MKKILAILVLAGAAFFFYKYFTGFNTLVLERFEGRLWELPARVYARPMEIYPGMVLNADRFEKELQQLGYRRLKKSDQTGGQGTYTRNGNYFELHCREFDFGDEVRPDRWVRISIKDNMVEGLRGIKAFEKKEMERLDPVIIGGFYPSSMEDRILVSMDDIPSLLKQTIVAVEDRNFYSHYGIDPKGVLRAMVANIKNRRMAQGASTLTQQLARNFFLTREKSLIRKVNEAFTAAALELHFTKDQILEAYINEVYLGQDGKRAIHGFGLAADFYFGKALCDLSVPEAALLVGMLKGPSAYNPRKSPDRALARRNTVLKLMQGQGLIPKETLEKSLSAPLGVIDKPAQGGTYPFYLDLVKRRLLSEYREDDLRTMGLRIFTALDPQVQLAAQEAAAAFLKKKDKTLETGIVVTSLAGNEIKAVVGARQFQYNGFNRALDSKRPIGSLVKPAVFLTALLHPQTYTLITPLSDDPIKIKNPDGTFWEPQNYDRENHGTLKLYQALVHSYNVSTVRLGLDLGLEAVAGTLEKLGCPVKKTLLPSMLLGSIELSPVQVAQVYHTLASGGFYTPAKSIRAVYTQEGEALKRYPMTIEHRLDSGAVFLVNKILQAVVTNGTGKSLEQWVPKSMGLAGKTGTTNDLRDSWFAGFSGSHTAVVWVGRDDNKPAGLTGASGALQVFGALMAKIGNTALTLPVPENIGWAVIDPETGARTDKDCPNAMAVPFVAGSEPEDYQSCHAVQIVPEQTKPVQTPRQKASQKAQPGKKDKPRYLMDWLKEIFK